jgi:C4-type Zn-finger protein
VARRSCPECGETVKVGTTRVEVLPDMPAIATPEWRCENCGWSSTDDTDS